MGAKSVERNPDGTFAPGHQVSVHHGGESGIKRLQRGLPFDSLALEAYEGVMAELGIDLDQLSGVDRVMVQRAARFEAVARLFDMASLAAASKGEIDRWEAYERRSGWIGGKAFNALVKLHEVMASAGRTHILNQAIKAAEEATSGTD